MATTHTAPGPACRRVGQPRADRRRCRAWHGRHRPRVAEPRKTERANSRACCCCFAAAPRVIHHVVVLSTRTLRRPAEADGVDRGEETGLVSPPAEPLVVVLNARARDVVPRPAIAESGPPRVIGSSPGLFAVLGALPIATVSPPSRAQPPSDAREGMGREPQGSGGRQARHHRQSRKRVPPRPWPRPRRRRLPSPHPDLRRQAAHRPMRLAARPASA
mmetsp:Transcript_9150/g.27246  ORF Transcript_9150/g.27246 Transcript_9150/m.27246 type:complete len:218 (+) Transcript_9150:253-906(+)